MKYIFLAIIYFCGSFVTEEETNDITTVVSMQSCGALKRSNNSYIVWNLVFRRMRTGSALCGFDWKENPKKELRQWKKVPLS